MQALDLTGEGDEWTHTFSDLPVYKDGQKVVYTVTEDKVDNYTTKIDGTTITNTYKPGKTSLTVTKNWKDANNQDGLRPKQSRFNCMLVIKRLVRLLNCQQITNGPIPSQT